MVRLALFYIWGFCVVGLHAFVASIFCIWAMQIVALSLQMTFDWSAILLQLVLSFTFLALFPGQRLWTLRLKGPGGQIYTIVGD